MNVPARALAATAVALAGCAGGGHRPAAGMDAYHAWLAVPPLEPVPSWFSLREIDGRWWFIAPSGRRFLAVSGATTPAAGRPVSTGETDPSPYFTAGIPGPEGGRPVPSILPGLPDPYDDATLPALGEAALPILRFADDPFCLGHLAIPGAGLERLPERLPVSASAAAERWFGLRTTGGTPAAFRHEFAERLYGLMTAALRGADGNHPVFTGWYEPGVTAGDIAASLGHWGDAVCVRLPPGPDAIRMAGDAHAATGRPLLVWLADPAAREGEPPDPALRTTGLALLALPYVVGLDTLAPPTADEAYRRHAAP